MVIGVTKRPWLTGTRAEHMILCYLYYSLFRSLFSFLFLFCMGLSLCLEKETVYKVDILGTVRFPVAL